MMTTAQCAADLHTTAVTIGRYITKGLLHAAMKVGGGRGTYLIDDEEWARFKRDVHPTIKGGRPRPRRRRVLVAAEAAGGAGVVEPPVDEARHHGAARAHTAGQVAVVEIDLPVGALDQVVTGPLHGPGRTRRDKALPRRRAV